ncbi:MAG: DUF11 domain-containing protein [Clostridium sp.]|uniref:DUF11 domain-containing protein n=1 Tax=Clostridium sp. TaxID=1506 RepID=UPI003F30F759
MALKTFYTKSDYLKMVHTGNSLGMKDNGSGSFSIGSFITLDPTYTSNSGIVSSVNPLTFAGTTNTIVNNGSWGRLMPDVADVPTGSTVDVAVLIWGFQGAIAAPLSIDQPITFIDATSLTHSIAPNLTYSVGPVGTTFYTRAADVTTIVSAAGMGDYAVTNVPNRALGSGNGIGWSLLVVYKNPDKLPYRNVSIFIGDVSNGGSATVSGFYTPPSGIVAARAFVMALYGDSDAGGDTFTLAGKSLSGPRNPATNFFASQVCDYNGNLATIGSFGDRNCTPDVAPNLQKAEFDLTNVDASGVLGNGIRTSTVGIGAGGDVITANAVALEINSNAANISINKTVDKATGAIGDTLVYTLVIENIGTSDAVNFILQDTTPTNTTIVPNSLFVNSIANTGSLQTGINIGSIVKNNGVATVSFSVTVNNGIPNPTTITNNAYGAFEFISDPIAPTITAGVISNNVDTMVFQDLTTIVKSVDKILTANGVNLVYAIAISNLNPIFSINTVTIVDSIPNTTSFVNGSVFVNGVVNASANPQTGINIGDIASNGKATVTFSVLCNGTTGTIPNYAIANYLYNGSINRSINSNTVNTVYADIKLTPIKTVDKVFTTSGGVLKYTISFTNNSNVTVKNVIFRDTIPSGTTLNSGSITLNGIGVSGDLTTGINIGDVLIGQTNTITFDVTVN